MRTYMLPNLNEGVEQLVVATPETRERLVRSLTRLFHQPVRHFQGVLPEQVRTLEAFLRRLRNTPPRWTEQGQYIGMYAYQRGGIIHLANDEKKEQLLFPTGASAYHFTRNGVLLAHPSGVGMNRQYVLSMLAQH